MDDFLGTSIQYSEQQIFLLEEQYAAQKKKDVEELINSGFLDSDYESSDSEMEETTLETYDYQSNIDEEQAYKKMTQLQPSSRSNSKVSSVSHLENVDSEYCVLELLATFMDIKSLILLFTLMVTVPPIMDPVQQIYKHEKGPIVRHQSVYNVYWFYAQREPECALQHMMNFDIMTTAINTEKNIKIMRHELKIKSLDVMCDDNGRYVAKETKEPQLFFLGAAFKSLQFKRIFKETVSRGTGQQLLCKQQLTALLMSFVVIAAVFALSHANTDYIFANME